MINCEQFANLLSQYIEGELTGEQNSEIKIHLKGCRNCHLLYQSTAKLIECLPKLKKEIPLPLKNRLKLIPQPEKKETIKPIQLKWIAAIISTVALLLNLFYFTNINPTVNKVLHNIIFGIEKITVKAAGLFEEIKESEIFSADNSENGSENNGN